MTEIYNLKIGNVPVTVYDNDNVTGATSVDDSNNYVDIGGCWKETLSIFLDDLGVSKGYGKVLTLPQLQHLFSDSTFNRLFDRLLNSCEDGYCFNSNIAEKFKKLAHLANTGLLNKEQISSFTQIKSKIRTSLDNYIGKIISEIDTTIRETNNDEKIANIISGSYGTSVNFLNEYNELTEIAIILNLPLNKFKSKIEKLKEAEAAALRELANEHVVSFFLSDIASDKHFIQYYRDCPQDDNYDEDDAAKTAGVLRLKITFLKPFFEDFKKKYPRTLASLSSIHSNSSLDYLGDIKNLMGFTVHDDPLDYCPIL